MSTLLSKSKNTGSDLMPAFWILCVCVFLHVWESERERGGAQRWTSQHWTVVGGGHNLHTTNVIAPTLEWIQPQFEAFKNEGVTRLCTEEQKLTYCWAITKRTDACLIHSTSSNNIGIMHAAAVWAAREPRNNYMKWIRCTETPKGGW